MKKLLVIQHEAIEGLGQFEKEIELAKLSFDLLKTYENPVFPSGANLEQYGALISLGSSQSVNDGKKFSWIEKELLIIKEALRQKMPILGIGFGAQLLALAAGARVSKGNQPEIGWKPIRFDDWFSKRNPLTFQLDLVKPHTVFQWHQETFDFPVEGYRLAWNDTTPGQMFAYQGNAIGIQFHVEMTEEMIRNLLKRGAGTLEKWDINAESILKEIPKYLPETKNLCHKFFYGFSSLIRENVRRAA